MVSTSTKILLLGASALAVGGLASKYKVGTGLSTLGTGTTEFLLAPARAGARTVSLFVGAGQEALGFTREVGGALADLKGVIDSITGASRDTGRTCLVGIPLNEACPPDNPFRRTSGDDINKCCNTEFVDLGLKEKEDEPVISTTQSDEEICRLLGTNELGGKNLREPCVRLTNAEINCISDPYCESPYTYMDLNQGRIGVR